MNESPLLVLEAERYKSTKEHLTVQYLGLGQANFIAIQPRENRDDS